MSDTRAAGTSEPHEYKYPKNIRGLLYTEYLKTRGGDNIGRDSR